MLLASLLAKSIVVKAALATAALSVTGAAVAAGTGTLPAPVQQIAHEYAGAPAPDEASPTPSTEPTTEPSEQPTAEPTGEPTTEPTEEPTAGPSKAPGGPDASGPAGFGLCRAYLTHGRKNGDPAWQALVTAAGGADKVAAYCQGVVTAKKTTEPEHPKAKPTPGSKPAPTAKPSQATGDHHGKPTPAPRPSSKGKGGGHN
jgi:hypothetical protein